MSMVWSCLTLCEQDLNQTHRSLAISCWHTLSDQIVLSPNLSFHFIVKPEWARASKYVHRAKSIKLNSLIPVKSSLRLIRSFPLYKSLAFIRHTRMTWVEPCPICEGTQGLYPITGDPIKRVIREGREVRLIVSRRNLNMKKGRVRHFLEDLPFERTNPKIRSTGQEVMTKVKVLK